jgi:phosphate/sulfate permease
MLHDDFRKIIITWLLAAILSGVLGYFVFKSYDKPPQNLPSDVGTEDILYKTCEPTGNFGQAEYWFITKDGHRYHVSQDLYDTLTEIPR